MIWTGLEVQGGAPPSDHGNPNETASAARYGAMIHGPAHPDVVIVANEYLVSLGNTVSTETANQLYNLWPPQPLAPPPHQQFNHEDEGPRALTDTGKPGASRRCLFGASVPSHLDNCREQAVATWACSRGLHWTPRNSSRPPKNTGEASATEIGGKI